MKAIHVESDEPGRPMVWRETADPVPGPGEVLVDVYAAALNRADLLQRAGGYPAPPGASTILGLDIAGQVSQLGQGVTGRKARHCQGVTAPSNCNALCSEEP
jgi:NADPH:quinone reductase-like Zn-dependent oxidoreductase